MFKNKKIFTFALITSGLITLSSGLLLSSCGSNKIVNPKTNEWNNVTNDYERYINQNELSLVFLSNPSKSYVNSLLNQYIKNIGTDNKLSQALRLFQNTSSAVYNFEMGTGWIFDYCLNNTTNINDYYIATNMHVLDCSYKLEIQGTSNNVDYVVDLEIPVNESSVENFNVFFSQPLSSHPLRADDPNSLSTLWYLTNLNKNNINNSIVPLGLLDSSGSLNKNNNSIDMKLSITAIDNKFLINDKPLEKQYNYWFYNNSYYTNDLSKAISSNTLSTDISLLKISLDKNKILPLNQSNLPYANLIFQNIQKMFDTNIDLNLVNKKSSYIARLAKLNDLANNKKENSSEFDNLFLFDDFNNIEKNNGTISIAGYPGYQQDQNTVYSRFNCNTASNSLIQTENSNPTLFKEFSTIRPYIEVNYNGKFFNSPYNTNNNCFIKDFNLQAGSSGSMALNSDYKISGIYWGIFSQINTDTNQAKINGVVSGIYNKSDQNCVLFNYLKYANQNIKNSQMLKLFTTLNNNGYFK